MPARKPTALLELSGAFDKNPQRKRTAEPNSGRGVGPAPGYLTEGQQEIWDEIVGNCAAGVFQSGDRLVLESLVVLVSEFRADPPSFGGRRYQQLVTLLSRCGMTPADRSRVTVPSAPQEKVGLAKFR